MKKLIGVAALTITMANAQTTLDELEPSMSKLCGVAASNALRVAIYANKGGTWDRLETMFRQNLQSKGIQFSELDETLLSVQREAFYSWAPLSTTQIRHMAFNTCMKRLRAYSLSEIKK